MQRNIKFALAVSVLALSQAAQLATDEEINDDVPENTPCERRANRDFRAYSAQCEAIEGLDEDGVWECMSQCQANDSGCAMACE